MAKLKVSYLGELQNDVLVIGHDEKLETHPNYLFVPKGQIAQKSFLAASASLCDYLKKNKKISEIEVLDRYEILYYLTYLSQELKLEKIIYHEEDQKSILPDLESILIREARLAIKNRLKDPINKLEIKKDFQLSICMATFNRKTPLEEALKSLGAQTDQDFELIVVNDGSFNEEAILFHKKMQKLYFNENKKWKWIDQDNHYLGAARNTAVKNSSGSVLLFLDDDNIPNENMVENYRKYWMSYPHQVFVSAFSIFKEEKPTAFNKWYPFPDALFSVTLANVIADAQCLISKELFLELGGYTEDIGVGFEDWEFYLKLKLKGEEIYPIYEDIYRYRLHQKKNSMREAISHEQSFQRAIRVLKERYPRLQRCFDVNQALLKKII